MLISPDEVLTASHLVYITGVGTATNIQVTADYSSGAKPFGTVQGISIHYINIDDANEMISNADSQDDFAVIHLAQPINTGVMSLEANYSGGTVHVTGYPASAGGQMVDSQQTVSVSPFYSLLLGTSIGAGSSGGPVWIFSNGQAEVVGTVSAQSLSDNTGYFNQITSSELAQIESWVSQDDGTGSGTGGGGLVTTTVTNVTASTGATGVILQFQGNMADYSLAQSAGSLTVTDSVATRDGTHIVQNAALAVAIDLQFADQKAFVLDGDGGAIARLYQAALDREPDQSGLVAWIKVYEATVSAADRSALVSTGSWAALASDAAAGGQSIAYAFTHSVEFQQEFGALSDTAFIAQLYQNALGRAPDAAGEAAWVAAIEGPSHLSREQVLVGFANSTEGIAHSAAWIISLV